MHDKFNHVFFYGDQFFTTLQLTIILMNVGYLIYYELQFLTMNLNKLLMMNSLPDHAQMILEFNEASIMCLRTR